MISVFDFLGKRRARNRHKFSRLVILQALPTHRKSKRNLAKSVQLTEGAGAEEVAVEDAVEGEVERLLGQEGIEMRHPPTGPQHRVSRYRFEEKVEFFLVDEWFNV